MVTGTDSYGFSALPVGGLYDSPYESSVSYDVGEIGYFWSASEDDSFDAYYMYIKDQDEYALLGDSYKSFAKSVRCLRNNF